MIFQHEKLLAEIVMRKINYRGLHLLHLRKIIYRRDVFATKYHTSLFMFGAFECVREKIS